MRNFAAVNERKRRQLASWVLLAVFLPMLVLSSLHAHQSAPSAADPCAECVHNHCGGHLSQHTFSIHQCVLCQFLTLPMLVATVVAVIPYNKLYQAGHDTWRRSVCVAHNGVTGLRAPPVLSF